MSPEQFIKKNVIEKLLAEGFTETQAEIGGVEAVSFYRRSSKPSNRSRNIFDDCLDQARLIVRYGRKNKSKSVRGQMF